MKKNNELKKGIMIMSVWVKQELAQDINKIQNLWQEAKKVRAHQLELRQEIKAAKLGK